MRGEVTLQWGWGEFLQDGVGGGGDEGAPEGLQRSREDEDGRWDQGKANRVELDGSKIAVQTPHLASGVVAFGAVFERAAK